MPSIRIPLYTQLEGTGARLMNGESMLAHFPDPSVADLVATALNEQHRLLQGRSSVLSFDKLPVYATPDRICGR